jgi:hypothetical protein
MMAAAALSLATASDTHASDKLVWSEGGIRNADLNGDHNSLVWPNTAQYVAINRVTGNVYWADNTSLPGKLMMASHEVAGSPTPSVVATTVPGERILHIAIDPAGAGTAYWDDFTQLHIYRADLPNGQPVLIPTAAQTIRGIALDLRPDKRHMYVYNGVTLWRSDLPNGTNEVELANSIGDGGQGGFVLDTCFDDVYVIGSTMPHPGVPVPYIRRARLSFSAHPSLSNITTVLSGDVDVGITQDVGHDCVIDLDLKARKMYWTSQMASASGQIRVASLNGSGISSIITASNGMPGVALALADYRCAPGLTFCSGDGLLPTPCPCVPPNIVPSLPAALDHGCANSMNLDGALFTAVGTVAPDTVAFDVAVSNNYVGFGIMIKGNGNAPNGIASGDGIRCVDGQLIRFGAHFAGTHGAPQGHWTYPNAAQTSSVSIQTAQPIGQPAYYQLFYRSAAANFCNASTTNWSNGYAINWP